MITVFNQCARCLLEPYAVLFVLFGIMLICSKKITVFYISVLCFALAVLWRSIFLISSSRYCAMFLLVIPIAASYIAKDYTKGYWGSIITLILGVFLLFYNTISVFASFRNNYIFDVREDIAELSQNNPEAVFFIPRKEMNRISDFDKHISGPRIEYASSPLEMGSIQPFFEQYDFGQKDSFFIIPEKAGSHSDQAANFMLGSKTIHRREIGRYYTNKQKRKKLSFYLLERFVPPFFHDADFRSSDLGKRVMNEGILKVYQPDFDVYIFQIDNKLLWFVGTDVDKTTEIIYQIHTTRPDLLPEERIKHGFDNRGFRPNPGSESGYFGKYRLFEREIPSEYPITDVYVGFNTSGTVTWSWVFLITDFASAYRGDDLQGAEQ